MLMSSDIPPLRERQLDGTEGEESRKIYLAYRLTHTTIYM
jgi:hypothetical protein